MARRIDPVEHQIHIRFLRGVPKGADMDAVSLDLLRLWMETGRRKHKYAEIVEVRWRNPARKTAAGRAWRSTSHAGQNWHDARATLKALRGSVRLGEISFRPVGRGGRVRRAE